jgi:hypothetical protein
VKIREYLIEVSEDNQTPANKPIALKPDIKKKVNKKIYNLTSGKYPAQIPLQDIFDILKEYNIVAVDEAGDPWSGFLTGRDGNAHIDLQTSDGMKIKNSLLLLQWHKMDSNNYEIVCYIT